ncbi:MAG: site-specific DNA-methyltransferase [Candidatus Marinimicrobia bacterium]|nr:site-specific DNA-methyltransferase [Candidatus Neomarinimicrobiota bacterium]
MDYIESVTIERLRKVIEGEDGGISKAVKWKGGGSFYFAELLKSNAIFLDEIENVQSKKILAKVFEKMKASGFLSYQVDITHIKDQMTLFNELSLDQQKQVLVELLDKNMLYVNYSEIDNKDYAVSEKDKALNKRLYSKL